MNNRRTIVIQGIILILISVALIVSFVIIRTNLILPKTKFNKIEEYYSGNLDNKSNYNDYAYKSITSEGLINRVFHDFNYKMVNNPKEAYELIKNKKTNKLFSNYDEFEKYANKNKDNLLNSMVKKYSANGKKCIVIDQYNHKYTFTITNPVTYTVTIELNS